MQDFDGGGQNSYRINYKAKKKTKNARFKILNNIQLITYYKQFKLHNIINLHIVMGKNIKYS